MAESVTFDLNRRYVITRKAVLVVIVRPTGGEAYPLPHLVHHSPDGFEFGYSGSGPADLARSLVGDFLGTTRPAAWVYQPVKDALVAPLIGDGPHWLTGFDLALAIEPDLRGVIEHMLDHLRDGDKRVMDLKVQHQVAGE